MSTWSQAGPRTVSEHAAAVAALLPPTGAEQVALAEASGRVLAEDLTAGVALPPFDNSAMDGYAVRAAELAGASPGAAGVRGVGRHPGRAHRRPRAGAGHGRPDHDGCPGARGCRRDRAGGADRRRCRAGPDHRGPEVGAFVRRAGRTRRQVPSCCGPGPCWPPQIGLAAAVGRAEMPVRRRPHVLVLSTGSELVARGALEPGQIYESNGTMLAVAVREAGATAEQLSFVPDDVERFRAVLAERVGDGVDLVLTSGGVSAGAYEVVKDAMTGHGVEFGKVAMQPGGPQGCGLLELDGSRSPRSPCPGTR